MAMFQQVVFLAALSLPGAGGTHLLVRHAPTLFPDKHAEAPSGPTVVVRAAYPGANCQVVADTVAAPIEQQVDGVANMLHMTSRCTNEGTYTLTVTFKPGVDVGRAQTLVHDRVCLAMPALPDKVQRSGVTDKVRAPHVLLLIGVSSPDASRDALFLSNYATLHLWDELARVPGAGEIICLGQRDFSVRIWLDPDKLAAHKLTACDVVAALQDQNPKAGGGQASRKPVGKGTEFHFTMKALGLLTSPEEFANRIVKKSPGGQPLRLRDVSRIELEAVPQEGFAELNGKPVVMLGIYPTPQARPRNLSDAVRDKLSRLRRKLPPGIDVGIAFDFTPDLEAPGRRTTPEYLLLDLDLPAAASPERTREVIRHCEKLLRKVEGVQDVLALSADPFNPSHNRACILVRLAPPTSGRPAGNRSRR
jgi:multidrug efflux pump subunit AcrB